tara:strand:- start:967 stop:1674 length:708 start_codon:yes stop_codon:yes gene_type:complete
MISEIEFEKKIIKIIDSSIKTKNETYLKEDFSLVTDVDILVEKLLIDFIRKNFYEINIISEENIESHRTEYFLDNKFAIIDPIDGTENFFHMNNIYGCAISVVYDNFNYHAIYIPEQKKIISTLNLKGFNYKNSNISLLSTSCINNQISRINNSFQNYRILGSSSYMFYVLLSGNAKSYYYCGKAKIWDYYTGISLALTLGDFFSVNLGGKKISNKLTTGKFLHKQSFKIVFNDQ